MSLFLHLWCVARPVTLHHLMLNFMVYAANAHLDFSDELRVVGLLPGLLRRSVPLPWNRHPRLVAAGGDIAGGLSSASPEADLASHKRIMARCQVRSELSSLS